MITLYSGIKKLDEGLTLLYIRMQLLKSPVRYHP